MWTSDPPALEIGLGFWNMQSGYSRPGQGPASYRQAADEVRLAETLGFDAVWVAEHHFSYDGYGPSPLPACGFLAAATQSIAVGTCILALPLHDPHRVSAALRALVALAPGRVRLGVGLGYREVEFTTLGRSTRTRARVIEENLDHLLEEGALEGVDLWMGGVSEAAIRRAARYGASLFLPPQTGSPQAVAEMRRIWETNLQPRDGQRPRFALFLQTWPARDEETVARIRRQVLEEWRSYSRFFVEDQILGASGADRDALAEQFLSTASIGTPGEILDRLLEYKAAGVDTFILWPRFGSLDGEVVRESIESLSAEVVPGLRSAR